MKNEPVDKLGSKGLRPAETARPIFLISHTRSGSSALVMALQSAGIPGWSEGHIFPLLDRLAGTAKEYYAALDPEARNPKHAVERISAGEMESALADLFASIHREHLGSEIWLDKTPTATMLEAVPYLDRVFPNAKFIFSYRRGIETIQSRQLKFPGIPFEANCRIWANFMNQWLHTRTGLRGPSLEITQRELALTPQKAGDKLAAFLGLGVAEAKAMGETLSSQRPEQSRPRNDGREIALTETGWSEIQQQTFREVCGNMMEVYGFSLEPAAIPDSPPPDISLFFSPVRDAVALRNLNPNGFRNSPGGFLLFPSPHPEQPAGVTYHNLQFRGHNVFRVKLGLSAPGQPMRCTLQVVKKSTGAIVVDEAKGISGTDSVDWEVSFPPLEGPHEVLVSSIPSATPTGEQAPGVKWIDPRFGFLQTV